MLILASFKEAKLKKKHLKMKILKFCIAYKFYQPGTVNLDSAYWAIKQLCFHATGSSFTELTSSLDYVSFEPSLEAS